MTKIHPSAVISPDAKIADGVEIGPYSVIGPEVEIGEGTYVGPHCVIEYSKIGKRNNIFASAFIGAPPQDYKYHGEKTYLEIGDENLIREGVSLHRGSPLTGLTKIGSGCFFMANSHVGHDCRLGNGIIMVNSAAAAGHTHIGDKAIISGLVGIHQFTRIGKYAMLSGGSMANLDIIPYVTAQGDRARPVGLNVVGLKRNGFSTEAIKAIKHVFKTLFFKNLKMKEALDKLYAENLPKEAVEILDFCKESKRGIARPRLNAYCEIE
ncbi:MAG: acyl-ACP--UDP-N-acetylglucosamine O-acyltransferase [Elusimicrobia bacterium]|nr:acyl-ACP--UDP-N-acetylglucosamine O-acyltransferase [Elusimicrobiota bacterium]